MACGAPAIVTDVPGLRDAVGTAGLLVPVGDHRTLADALDRLAEKADLRSSLRIAGIKRAAPFTWTRVAQEVVEVYREVLARRARSARSAA